MAQTLTLTPEAIDPSLSSGEVSHLRYRADLDGLRALAVLAVVASHVGLRFCSGGFVGVDVFFVISGYLIGGILLREVAANARIDYLDFYERRIRRIFPALLAMLVAVTFVAYQTFLPIDLVSFARMGAAALLFSSNIALAHSGGYFDFSAANNYLTHTWSLGVEEQFYIVLPPLLMLLRRKVADRSIEKVILWLTILSFAASIPATRLYPTWSFYLLPTRFWELLTGILAFLYAPRLANLTRRCKTSLALVGLLCILVPIALYSPATTFPGLAALPPCLGTALILATGSTLVHRAFARPVPVLIGQFSYSLYLWHWPLIVYDRMHPFTHQHTHLVKFSIVAASMAIAYASWRWIETPFRKGRFKPSRLTLFAVAGGLSACALASFAAFALTHGAAYRFSPLEQQIASYRDTSGSESHYRFGTCFLEKPSSTQLPDWSACLAPDRTRPNVLLLGSSLIAQMRDALGATYPELHFLQATSPNCQLQSPASPDQSPGCPALMHYIFQNYLPRHHVDAVVFQIEPDQPSPQVLAEVLTFFRQQNTHVYVVGSQVTYTVPGPSVSIASLRHPDRYRPQTQFSETMLKDTSRHQALIRSAGATAISMSEILCPNATCTLFAAPGVPMQMDQVHLTYPGTEYVARAWRTRGLLLAP